MNSSVYRKIGIASALMMASVMASRVIGLGREMTIAYIAGAGREVDAYQLAFIIPEILNHIAASGFLSVTFIPLFTRRRIEAGEPEAWRLFSLVLSVLGSFALLGVAAAMVFAPALVSLAAPGLTDPQVLAAAVRMTRIILPAQLCFFAGGLLMAVQFASERFFLPALAPLVYNLGIIAGGVLLEPVLGIEGFAWGASAGAFGGALLLQWAGARRVGLRFGWCWKWRDPALGEYIRLTLPLMVGLTMAFSTEFFFRFFGSYLPAGGVAVLNFGLRVMLVLVGVFGQALGVASFPYLARLAAEEKMAELNALLNATLRYLALVIPVAVFLMVVSPEVVRVLFQRGRFEPADTLLTANVLKWLLAGAFAYSAYTVVARGYFATRNTMFPAVFGSLAVLASLPIYYLGTLYWGAEGLALAISISGILQVLGLFAFWNRRSANPGRAGVYRFYLNAILLGLGLFPVLGGVRALVLRWADPATLAGSLASIALTGAVFAGLMLAAACVFKIDEITGLLARLRRPKSDR
jgi:putative peptidoglycan lipid II flippase